MSLAFETPVERRPPDDSSRAVKRDEAFEALANRRRRHVVHWLLEAETGTELRQLSRRVAAWENEKPADQVTAQERRRVYNALQQFHLPKLDDIGVIRYDADRGDVEPTAELASLRSYLNATQRSHRWCFRFLVLGGATTGLVAVLAGAPSVTPLLGVAFGVLVLSLLAYRYIGAPGRNDPLPTDTEPTDH